MPLRSLGMRSLDIPRLISERVEAIRRAVGDGRALVAVSGGVDSTVSAVIARRALGDRLLCIFIDDNFMRQGEPERVRGLLSSPPLNLQVKIVDERDMFMEALKGLRDAEEKRKAFREAFYRTLGEVSQRENCSFLVQGTIRADIVETERGIKTQHNVLEQIGIDPAERYGLRVLEPISDLYKEQVREVARYLGVPKAISERQPFPGPGLSIRVLGEVTLEKLETLKAATEIVEKELESHEPDQYFPAILGMESEPSKALSIEASRALGLDPSQAEVKLPKERATGIIEGKRSYGLIAEVEIPEPTTRARSYDPKVLERMRIRLQEHHPEITRILYLIDREEKRGYSIALRAVTTEDFLRALPAEIPWRALEELSRKILNKCEMVSSIYYDVTPKPPGTIEFE
ncbi:MAG: GMP synthase [Candidatus Bathyarchaeia archaeon]